MTRTFVALTIGTLLGLGAGALTHAAAGGGSPWSSGPLVAQATPPPAPKRAPTPPAPPARPGTPAPAPAPPPPPAPPAPLTKTKVGVSVTIKDGKVKIDGVRELVERQLADAKKRIANDPNIPKDVRDKISARMDKARAIVDKRLANLKSTDLDDLEDELEKMGEELEKEMEGLEDEMEKLGKSLAKMHGLDLDIDLDFDDDDDDYDRRRITMAPGVDIDPDDDDLRDAISDLKDLAVKPAQRDAIVKLRTDSDKTVADAKKKVDELSAKLHTALGNAQTTDAEISSLVDQISAQEAVIRKARIVAWNQARRLLDDNQRKKIEAAKPKKK